MAIRIDGGTVVGWSGAHHELIPDGSVLVEGDTITYVGRDRAKPADQVIHAPGKLICPGFINLHVHSQLNVGDYLITDVTKKDYLSANWFVFGAPTKEAAASAPPPEAVAIGRKYALFSALKNGATTVLDPGGGPGDLGAYVEIVGEIGGRVFFGPPYRSRDIYTDAAGRHYYEDRADGGRPGLQRAVDFIRAYHGAKNGLVQGILNPAQAETCEPGLLEETAAAAKELDVGIHIHAAGNLRELVHLLYNYRKPAIEYLAEAGILGPRTVLGHAVFISGHSRVDYPFGDELKLIAESGASVGHCPHKYAKMAIAAESFDRYVDAGVNVALGTDTYPLDIVSEMRYASLISRLVDRKYHGARPERVFNAATVWGAKALGRDDLGKLAPGAKADIVIVNLRTARYGPVRDPITALVEYGSGADVETVIVNGEVVVSEGRSTRVDEDELYARAEAAAKRAWDNWPKRDWAGRSVEEIVPPAFPTRGP
ncbi:MAG TPA: amidohydrolase family protein [Candidatus Acidoferrales bacterium]|nr:amidohydrolase family protein [Candidatus Acidoferrales bacterium]